MDMVICDGQFVDLLLCWIVVVYVYCFDDEIDIVFFLGECLFECYYVGDWVFLCQL